MESPPAVTDIHVTTTLSDGRTASMWICDEYVIVRIEDELCYVPVVWRWIPTGRVGRLGRALVRAAA